jgi:hypothetical protein
MDQETQRLFKRMGWTGAAVEWYAYYPDGCEYGYHYCQVGGYEVVYCTDGQPALEGQAFETLEAAADAVERLMCDMGGV